MPFGYAICAAAPTWSPSAASAGTAHRSGCGNSSRVGSSISALSKVETKLRCQRCGDRSASMAKEPGTEPESRPSDPDAACSPRHRRAVHAVSGETGDFGGWGGCTRMLLVARPIPQRLRTSQHRGRGFGGKREFRNGRTHSGCYRESGHASALKRPAASNHLPCPDAVDGKSATTSSAQISEIGSGTVVRQS